MSDQNKKKSRGLGDTVKKAITVTTFGLVKQKPGCGCEGCLLYTSPSPRD